MEARNLHTEPESLTKPQGKQTVFSMLFLLGSPRGKKKMVLKLGQQLLLISYLDTQSFLSSEQTT